MRWAPRISALAAILLLGCGDGTTEIPIVNAGFEAPVKRAGEIPGWTVIQHAGPPSYETAIDTKTRSEGAASFRIRRIREQVYGSIFQRVPVANLAGKTVELSAMLKTEDVGDKGWILQLTQTSGSVDRVSAAPLTGTTDFTRVTLKAKILAGTREVEIAASLRDGGTAWIDAVHLRVTDP